MPRKREVSGSAAPRVRPSPKSRSTTGSTWSAPPLGWILHAGSGLVDSSPPARILCGGLMEAFALAQHLREADVTAVEPDAEVAAAARAAARRRRLRHLRIEHGSLDQPAFGELVGGNFDLIMVQDALHRAADSAAALHNLASAAAPAAPVYLALRGGGHPASRLGPALEAFGLGSDDLTAEHAECLAIARLVASMGDFLPNQPRDLPLEISRAAGRPLSDWLLLAAQAGLNLRATSLTAQALPSALMGGGTGLLASFDLPHLAGWLEMFLAPPLVACVLVRNTVPAPPWREPGALAAWRPLSRFLDTRKIAPSEPPLSTQAAVEVEIPGVLPSRRFILSRYLVEILRRADGRVSLGLLMEGLDHQASLEELVSGLHFLHYSFILELLPPGDG